MAESGSTESLGQRAAKLFARAQTLRPVRVAVHYIEVRGPILGSGLAYSAIFAVFAGLYVGFAIAGLVISGDIGLRQSLISFVNENVPGLIQAGDGAGGAIDPQDLLNADVFGWTGAFALAILLVIAVSWLGSARDAVRGIFELDPLEANFALLKLKDLGLAVAFGAVLLVSALLSVAGTQATGFALGLLGIDEDSLVGTVLGRIVTLTIMFALDASLLAGVYRILSGVPIPWRRLRGGALIGAAALGGLKVAASASLIGAGGTNPLLSSFTVIIGLLIFFNLICQVILIAAAWIAVGIRDRGIVLDPALREKRLDEARELIAAHRRGEPEPPQEPAAGPRRRRTGSRKRRS
ncbi:YihY/virulence factor BrkB family protein [Lysobacter korlensis]|uniref:YihY/virulence factor BrkB family protein n=1 Tax=Lysobacter korlensis TaxID=553636 RepID=A0ABV6S1J5_9GAMM